MILNKFFNDLSLSSKTKKIVKNWNTGQKVSAGNKVEWGN